MLRYLAISLVLGSAFTSAGWAQQSAAPAVSGADAEAVARARARADEIIAQAAASDLFENITTSAAANIRHRQSGMECSFDTGDAGARITVYPNSPRGDDVSCGGKTLDILTSTYATRFPPEATQQQIFELSLRAVRVLHPDAKEYKELAAQISAPALAKLPVAEIGYFTFTDKDGSVLGKRGAKLVSRLAVASYNGWMFKQRMSAPEDQAMTLSILGEVGMMALMQSATKPAAAEPGALMPPAAVPRPEGSPPNQ